MARSKKGKTAETADKDKAGTDDTLPQADDSLTSQAEDIVEAVDAAIAEDTLAAEQATAEDGSDTVNDTADDLSDDLADTPLDDADPEKAKQETAADDADLSDDGADLSSTDQEDTLGDDTLEAAIIGDPAPLSETAHAAIAPQVIKETTVERKGGFVPMLAGGAVAAVLGFAAAQFTDVSLPFMPAPAPDPFQQEVQVTLDAQADQLAALETGLGDTQKAIEVIDLNPLMSALAGAEDRISETNTALAGLSDQIAGFDSRLTALEKQPVASAVGPEAIAAYERELDELRTAIQAQRDAVDAQRAEIQAMAKDAMQAESNAEGQAALAASRAALAQVTSAVQAGQPFAEPLGILSANGVAVPDALTAVAADGVPTLTALATDFPALARDALRAARTTDTESEEGGGGLASFFQNQLGARSVTPREGNDPDAVLSRAEAAVKTGDLDAAMNELSLLPEPAQAVLSDWTAQAEARRAALAAAGDLAQQLNQ